MKIAITGATGFIGNHLARLLCERGEQVRALVRPNSRRDMLEALPVELVTGDLLDSESLSRLVKGASVVYHVAADYRLWSRTPKEIYRSNIEGSANVFSAALAAGVKKLVYTSTVGCLGIPRGGASGDETTPVTLSDMVGRYKRSKFLAEQVALEYANRGLPIVIVNPSTPIGPGDHKPTPTGKIIVDFLNGKMPAYVDTGLNLIHVRDCAAGHILAAEKGKIGERYILGNRNVTLAEFLQMIGSVDGRRAPTVRIPYAMAYVVGALSEISSRVTQKPPGVSLESVKMSRKKMWFSADKAVRELGLPQSRVEDAVADAVNWFIDSGYAPGLRRAA